MNIELTQDMNMVGACINVANDPTYTPVWQNQPPLDFTADLADVSAAYEDVQAKDALADAAAGGAADAKAAAETALENTAFKLARALCNHFTKTGDLVNLAKADYTKTDIKRLRNQNLLDECTALRDLGNATVNEPGAAGRGVTPDRVTALTTALGAFKLVMNLPRGQIVNRATLKREVETDVAALVAKVGAMDDLVVQFDETDLGKRFVDAWKHARTLVLIGGSHPAAPAPAPTPAPAPAPTTPTGGAH